MKERHKIISVIHTVSIAIALMLFSSVGIAKTILVLGDSLSAAYGIPTPKSWVTLLETQLEKENYHYHVVNASISGETSAGGRARFPLLIKQHQPQIVIIELGANDGLRGLPVAHTKDNLKAIIELAQASKIKILIIGMQLPPNYGKAYVSQFENQFAELAKNYQLAYVPSLFASFGQKREFFQEDNLHPTVEAQPFILQNVWSSLKTILKHK